MQLGRKLRLGMTIGAVASALSLGLIAPTVSGAAAPSGTITFAEGAGANPNYIFPYMGCAYFSVSTINQFQELMFRPLYWFGLAGSVAVQPKLSTANMPVMSNGNRTATITMKGWKFADGQTVNAQSVMFFLNMYNADPTSYCGFNGSLSIPTLIKSAAGHGNTVVLHFTKPLNPTWLLYNNLSMITPMPEAWDRTSPSQVAHCSTGAWGAASTKVACKNVEAYLDAQSGKTNTYTGKMWQSGVDGPWRLTSFDNLGNATFQPNPRYSGPQKAQVQYFKEVAYTSTQAEENDLQAGKIDLGYVDPGVLTAPAPAPGKVGPNWGNLSSRYNMSTGTSWGFNYAPFNFSPQDPKSAAIAQLYIRQAIQMSMDQNGILTNIFKGYGQANYSPVPTAAPKSLSAPFPNPYPFNLSGAKALLTSHGWTMQNGVMTCTNPGTGSGQCGAGITQGYTLNLKMIYLSGYPAYDKEIAADIANWNSIGINMSYTTTTFNNVIGSCNGGAGFELCWWGGGWIYAPDFLPTGESLFTPDSGFNPGSYNDPKRTQLVNATVFGTANLTAYAKYAAEQLPVLYMPAGNSAVGETIKTLKSNIGWTPNPLFDLNPEYLHY